MSRLNDANCLKNVNMVMNIKNKFESNHGTTNNTQQNAKTTKDTRTLPNLSRQLSDPVKVKRTPAFRCDQKPFQRGLATSYREKKTVLRVSDKPSSVHVLRRQFDSNDNADAQQPFKSWALKERSNSSAEIIINHRRMQHDYENVAALYTEPIPKSQRNFNAIHNMSTLQITDKCEKTEKQQKNKNNNHKISDDINYKLDALTDTLKLALRKPLPAGPAPQKPPRTFTHKSNTSSPTTSNASSPVLLKNNHTHKEFAAKLNANLQKNLKQNLTTTDTSANTKHSNSSHRPDPKYMLDKLENALRTNKIRKNSRSASEDRQTSKNETKVDTMSSSASKTKLNLNCLPSLRCNNNTYDRLPESKKPPPKKHGEPVYAEPFAFLKSTSNRSNQGQDDFIYQKRVCTNSESNLRSNRSSLYYMSTPISTEYSVAAQRHQNANHEPIEFSRNMEPSEPPQFTDDGFDTPSSNSSLDDSSPKIKDLIKSFEENKSGLCTSTDRVDELGKQLRRTLEQSFNDSTGTTSNNINDIGNNLHDKEDQKNEACLGKFETYVRTIRLITKQSHKRFEQRQMFHSCMLVTLCDKVPYVKFNYPPNAALPANIAELCFPDSHAFDSSPKAQTYSIVLTQADGERIYGYCRRILPEDSQCCLPLAYCILSKNRAHRFYNRILEEVESRHGIPDRDREILLHSFYCRRFPNPGETVSFNLNLSQDRRPHHYAVVNGAARSADNNVEHIEIILHQDARHKENDIEELCLCLDTNLLLKLFASLLLERKVILLSCQLGRLSICIEALQNILYPFSWPHTLIPVLPKKLWEIVEAPTPLICGALSSMVLKDHEINDAIVIDLDNGTVLLEVGDEINVIPNCLWKEFKDGLVLAKNRTKEPTTDIKSINNVLISDAFLRIFVHSCGHYKDFISSDNKFDLDGFVQYPKKKAVRRFLKWFTQTSMFSTFVDNVVRDKHFYKIFENRTRIYCAQDATIILDKMKEWRKD